MRMLPRSFEGKLFTGMCTAFFGLMNIVQFKEAESLLEYPRPVCSDSKVMLSGCEKVRYFMSADTGPGRDSLHDYVNATAFNALFYYPSLPGIELACMIYNKE